MKQDKKNSMSSIDELRALAEEMQDETGGTDFLKALESIQNMSDRLYGDKDVVTPMDSSYCCSIDLVKDMRELEYNEKAKVLKLFHKELRKHEYWYHSMFGERFNETFGNVRFLRSGIDKDDDSICWLGYAVNDFDNLISAIDYDDPMTFFDLACVMEKEMRKKTMGSAGSPTGKKRKTKK